MSRILKLLNDENYCGIDIYADTEEELVSKFAEHFDEKDEEEIKEIIEWEGKGIYDYMSYDIRIAKIETCEAFEWEEHYATKSKEGWLFLNEISGDNQEEIENRFLDYLESVVIKNPKFDSIKRFNIEFHVPQKNLEKIEELKEMCSKILEDKKNIYHQYAIWRWWQEHDYFYSIMNKFETFVHAFSEEDIKEALSTDKFEEFLDKYEISYVIEEEYEL